MLSLSAPAPNCGTYCHYWGEWATGECEENTLTDDRAVRLLQTFSLCIIATLASRKAILWLPSSEPCSPCSRRTSQPRAELQARAAPPPAVPLSQAAALSWLSARLVRASLYIAAVHVQLACSCSRDERASIARDSYN